MKEIYIILYFKESMLLEKWLGDHQENLSEFSPFAAEIDSSLVIGRKMTYSTINQAKISTEWLYFWLCPQNKAENLQIYSLPHLLL